MVRVLPSSLGFCQNGFDFEGAALDHLDLKS